MEDTNVLGEDLVSKAKEEIKADIENKRLKAIKNKIEGIQERERIIKKYSKENVNFEDVIAKIVSMSDEEFLESDYTGNNYWKENKPDHIDHMLSAMNKGIQGMNNFRKAVEKVQPKQYYASAVNCNWIE